MPLLLDLNWSTVLKALACFSNLFLPHFVGTTVFIGRTDVEAETPIVWPPDAKSWVIWKDPDAVQDWRQEEKETTDDEMGRWHHWLNGHEWVNSERWWWTGRSGVLQSMGLQRDWATELNWTVFSASFLDTPRSVQTPPHTWSLFWPYEAKVIPLFTWTTCFKKHIFYFLIPSVIFAWRVVSGFHFRLKVSENKDVVNYLILPLSKRSSKYCRFLN